MSSPSDRPLAPADTDEQHDRALAPADTDEQRDRPFAPAETDDQRDDGFELLWAKVLEQWDDDKLHAAFLDYARERMQLPEAGARYRKIKDTDPQRAERAEKQLGRLMALAVAMLESARETAPQGPPRWITAFAYAVAAVFLAVLIRKVLEGR